MSSTNQSKALIIGYGNPGRQDDGLGPSLIKRLEASGPESNYTIDLQSNYQLTVEDAYDLQDYSLVVFVDACLDGESPFSFTEIRAQDDQALGSHSVLPESLLQLCVTLYQHQPKAYMLGIRGYEFDAFEESLSPQAQENCKAAYHHLCTWLSDDQLASRVHKSNKGQPSHA